MNTRTTPLAGASLDFCVVNTSGSNSYICSIDELSSRGFTVEFALGVDEALLASGEIVTFSELPDDFRFALERRACIVEWAAGDCAGIRFDEPLETGLLAGLKEVIEKQARRWNSQRMEQSQGGL